MSALLALALVAPLQASDAETETTMRTLKNGMRLIVAPRSYNRILALNLFVAGGSAEDPIGKEGLANLTQNLLLKGAGGRSAEQIALAIESVGGQIDVSVAEDYAEINTVTTVADLDVALSLLADVALKPAFPPEEVEKERELVLSSIRRREDDQFGYTYREFLKALYEGHPYGHTPEGDEAPVKALSREDIVQFHQRLFEPSRMLLVACGDVEADALAKAVEKRFQAFPAQGSNIRVQATKQAQPRFRHITLAKDCRQAFIVIGYPAVGYGDPDYPALRVANAILGEGMSGRLFVRLRDRQSLAYAVGSALAARRMAGHLLMYLGTSPETEERARLGLLKEARDFAREGISSDELERAKEYVVGKHLIARQANQEKAHYLGVCEMLGVGFAFDDRLPDLIRAVTSQQAMQAMDRYTAAGIAVTLMPEGAIQPPSRKADQQ